MSSPKASYACRWLIRDTFRQSMANYLFWVMLAASAVVIFFCLSVNIEGGEPLRQVDVLELGRPHGHMSLAFGAWRIPLFRDGQAQVHFVLLLLAEWIAGGGGTDTISYTNATGAVTVNVQARTATGYGADSFSAIENVIGSTGNDSLIGMIHITNHPA